MKTRSFSFWRVVSSQLKMKGECPLLNLGLVLDRSGSMQGDTMRHAKANATFAIQQLQTEELGEVRELRQLPRKPQSVNFVGAKHSSLRHSFPKRTCDRLAVPIFGDRNAQ